MLYTLYAIGVVISLTILIVALRNYRRKSGIFIRGNFSTASSRDCDDQYVAEVLLENQKDRTVTIFGIYLQLGFAYHIEIENLERSPFLLKPYETYHKEYGPIEFYAVSLKKVDFNDLFDDKSVRKRLVLSTSEGRYVVRESVRRWHPLTQFFSNHFAAVAQPIKSVYKDRTLGGNIKYVVEFAKEDGNEEVVSIHPEDYKLQKFRAFNLTKDALESKDSLKKYLEDKNEEGVLACSKILVHDLEEWRDKSREYHKGPRLKARHVSAFKFYVLGKLYTWYSDWKLKVKNKRAQRGGNSPR